MSRPWSIAGLNFLFLSIDGASQDVYSRFRRGGDLALCLDNVRRLLAARERKGSNVPYILWRFLTFEHNLHEVDEAIRIATDLGVDQISITTPFAVDWDDPQVRVARSPREGTYLIRPGATFKGPLDDWREVSLPEAEIEREFARPWAERLGGGPLEEPSRSAASTCAWLYQSLTLDARGRVTPCCMTPEVGLASRLRHLPRRRRPDVQPAGLSTLAAGVCRPCRLRRRHRCDPGGRGAVLCRLHGESRAHLHPGPRRRPRPRAARQLASRLGRERPRAHALATVALSVHLPGVSIPQ